MGAPHLTIASTRPRIARLSSARLAAVGVVCAAGDAGRWTPVKLWDAAPRFCWYYFRLSNLREGLNLTSVSVA